MTGPILPFEVGEILADKFRVEKVLGQGGMGVVIAATHLALNKRVALKFMLGDVAASVEFSSRFLQEATIAASLSTDHVAKVLDVGTLETGAPYMVLEHLDGTDLLEIVEANGPIPVDYACEYIMQAALGLADAHARDIIHRDIKPANLFLTTHNGKTMVKILDFGIAKAANDLVATQTEAVMGAPLYMSPEQMRSAKRVDARADIWSLGASLYQLLTGKVPFDSPSLPGLCIAIMSEPPTPFAESGVDVPPEVQRIVLQCLAKLPEDRPQSALDLARQLSAFSASKPSIHGDAPVSPAMADQTNSEPGNAPARAAASRVAAPRIAHHDASRFAQTTVASPRERVSAPSNRRWMLVAGVAGIMTLLAIAYLIVGS